MEKQFTTPVSMKVTEAQFKNDLEQQLLEMGYKLEDIESFLECNTIATNYAGVIGCVTNVTEYGKEKCNRYYIPTYNPKKFLALAGMTNSPRGNVGEWWKCVEPYGWKGAFEKNKLYKQSSNKHKFILLDNDNNMQENTEEWAKDFIKATKEEIIAFFSEKEIEKEVEQELIGYRFRNDEFNKMSALLYDLEYHDLRRNGTNFIAKSEVYGRLKSLNLLDIFCEPVYKSKETPISYEEAINKLNENSKVKYTKVK